MKKSTKKLNKIKEQVFFCHLGSAFDALPSESICRECRHNVENFPQCSKSLEEEFVYIYSEYLKREIIPKVECIKKRKD